MNDTLAPHNVEAEEAVLGSALIGGSHVLDELTWLKPSDFFIVKNGWIFEAILNLHRRKEAVDNLTVTDELRARGQLETVGGTAYIAYLMNITPTYIHAVTYARIVESDSRRRRMLSIASGLAQGAVTGDKEKIKELVQLAKSMLDTPDDGPEQLRQYLLHVGELDSLPEVTWLKPGIIPSKGLVMYYGPSGVGKSFLALDLAHDLAQAVPVVYIAAEGEYGLRLRSQAWRKHHQVDAKDLKLYFFANIVSLIDDKEREAFMKVVAPLKPALIIVDTVAHCMLPGNENDTRDMGLFVKGTKDMQKAFDCAALLVHHTNKGGKVERGNSSLRAACDVIARITGEDESIIFECQKTKDVAPFETRYLRLVKVQVDDQHDSRVVLPSEKVVQTKNDPLTRSQRIVLDLLKMPANQYGLTRAEIADQADMSNGQVGRVLSDLMGLGHVKQEERRGPYLAVTADTGVIEKKV